MSETNQEADPNMEQHHRQGDPPLMKVTREIPLPWLVGVIVGLVVQAVTVYSTQQAQSQVIKDMTIELRELRSAAQAGGLKTVEHDLKIVDHERRLNKLEAAGGK